MLGKLFAIICILSAVILCINGNISEFGNGVVKGASAGVQLSLSMCGMMCFWSGVMRVLRDMGAVRVLSRLMRPFLKLAFPEAAKSGDGLDEISASLSANALGLSNAATPLALAAMEKLKRSCKEGRASNDMISFVVLNTVPFCIFPSTVVTLRHAAGSSDPFSVILPVWICSLMSSLFALLICRIMTLVKRSAKGDKRRI
ncbi:MAG: spore maturation protein A [Ruminococcaceae bacterium]|nr:spore maturation protein A [Oscillospiraceae bacterium]